MLALLESRGRDYYRRRPRLPARVRAVGRGFPLTRAWPRRISCAASCTGPEYATWLTGFLPRIPRTASADWLAPGVVTDRSDPKLAHIDGLNLSRAWMLEGIAAGLPKGDRRVAAARGGGRAHAAAALPAVTGEHYEGGHWLGTFATYYTTRAGLPAAKAP